MPARNSPSHRPATASKAPRARVGCAGWSIPARYRDLFGPGDSMLARYATVFRAVEINSSFHRPHQARTYARWAEQVPVDFRFSVKIPRTISHDHGLLGVGPLLDRFLGEAGELGGKLGGFLLQLPPGLALDARSASSFFRMLRRRTDAPLACEPRHASWMSPQADALLAHHDVARVDADPPRAGAAAGPPGSASWRYWRWHGSPRVYYSDYPEERLQALARNVARVPKRQPAWVIFDNTAHGYAIANAARLQELLRDPAVTKEDADA